MKNNSNLTFFALFFALVALLGGFLALGRIFPNENFPDPTKTPTVAPTVTPRPTPAPKKQTLEGIPNSFPGATFLKDLPGSMLDEIFTIIELIILYAVVKLVGVFVPPIGVGLHGIEAVIGWFLSKIGGLIFKGLGRVPNLLAIGAFLLFLVWPSHKDD